MHDQSDLEKRGVPGVFIATTEFRDGADVQAASLGMTPTAVYVPHPVQDRTDDEMLEMADRAFDEVVAALVGTDSDGASASG